MRPDLTKKKPKKYYRVIMRWYSEVDVEASSIEEAEQLGVYHKYSTPHLDEVEVDQIKKSEVDPEVDRIEAEDVWEEIQKLQKRRSK